MSEGMVKRSSGAPPARVDDASSAEHVFEYLGFVLADEHYALPLTSVREILKVPPVTEVPRAPRDVLGIVSVRGRVTTVLDLRRRLRMPESPIGKNTRVLLVDEGSEVLGVLVDGVLSVVRLSEDEVELATHVGGDTADYVRGIGRPQARSSRSDAGASKGGPADDDLLILLDPQHLLRR